MVVVAQLVRALVCGTRGRGFEPHLPPKRKKEIDLIDQPPFFFVSASSGFPMETETTSHEDIIVAILFCRGYRYFFSKSPHIRYALPSRCNPSFVYMGSSRSLSGDFKREYISI